jgi:hypothetical protein
MLLYLNIITYKLSCWSYGRTEMRSDTHTHTHTHTHVSKTLHVALKYRIIKKCGLNFVPLYIRNWVHLFESLCIYSGVSREHIPVLIPPYRFIEWTSSKEYIKTLLSTHTHTQQVSILSHNNTRYFILYGFWYAKQEYFLNWQCEKIIQYKY